MAIYDYRCSRCGTFEVSRPMNDAATICCASCGGLAGRIFGAPNVAQLQPALRGALAREERSAHDPQVVRRPAQRAARAGGSGLPAIGHAH